MPTIRPGDVSFARATHPTMESAIHLIITALSRSCAGTRSSCLSSSSIACVPRWQSSLSLVASIRTSTQETVWPPARHGGPELSAQIIVKASDRVHLEGCLPNEEDLLAPEHCLADSVQPPWHPLGGACCRSTLPASASLAQASLRRRSTPAPISAWLRTYICVACLACCSGLRIRRRASPLLTPRFGVWVSRKKPRAPSKTGQLLQPHSWEAS